MVTGFTRLTLWLGTFKIHLLTKPDAVVHTWNPGPREAEARGLMVRPCFKKKEIQNLSTKDSPFSSTKSQRSLGPAEFISIIWAKEGNSEFALCSLECKTPFPKTPYPEDYIELLAHPAREVHDHHWSTSKVSEHLASHGVEPSVTPWFYFITPRALLVW